MTFAKTVLIVDDEVDFANGLTRLVASGFPELRVLTAHSGGTALEVLASCSISTMLLDLNMPGMPGLKVIAEVRKNSPSTSIVVLTAHGTVETAVSAIKKGAWDFLTKPVRRDDFLRALAKSLEHSMLLEENQRLKQIMAESGMERPLIGTSPRLRTLRKSIAAVASSTYTVLIRGESGTGKELVAEANHYLSAKQSGPLVKVNCLAIPESLLESELFGYTKGAFTGATASHRGMFVQASGGTLFLDEVGDISPSVQTKLLRALQDGEVRPLGSHRAMRFDTRIIAATNQNLEAKIRQGTFREDLFYRLNVLSIDVPSLRERKEDIPVLAAHFLSQSCAEMNIPEKTLSPAAMGVLTLMEWPGNVRELQSFVRRAAVFSSGSVLDLPDLDLPPATGEAILIENRGGRDSITSYKDAKNSLLEAFSRAYMTALLTRTGGNISEAARNSGLERVSLQKILRRLGMAGADFRR